MAVAIGDVLRVAAIQKFNAIDDVVNVLHFGVTAVPTPNDDATLLSDLASRVGSAWVMMQSQLVNNLEPDNLTVFNVTQDAPVGITSWGGGYTGGTSVGEAIPLFSAALVLLSTAVKRKQGRIYIGGLSEAANNDGELPAGTQTDIAQCVDALMNNGPEPDGWDGTLTVYSRGSGIPSPITTVRIQPLIARMGSRKPGRGS